MVEKRRGKTIRKNEPYFLVRLGFHQAVQIKAKFTTNVAEQRVEGKYPSFDPLTSSSASNTNLIFFMEELHTLHEDQIYCKITFQEKEKKKLSACVTR